MYSVAPPPLPVAIKLPDIVLAEFKLEFRRLGVSDVERIRDFVIEELHWQGSRSELTEDFPLIENHVVDSMGLLRLVAWLESTFGVAIADEDVVPANFGTIQGIKGLLSGRI
jgi:acyl carrier protein